MERLQKVMAHAGVDSRRKCEQIIVDGRVTVNGERVTELGTKVSPADYIEVDGVPIYKEEPQYILFYKPENVISAVSDDKGRPVVTDYIHVPERIYPVGRLDFDTSGLLLMTNDGNFAHLMMHPKFQLPKTYIARVDGFLNGQKLKTLEEGVVLDGKRTSKARAKVLDVNKKTRQSLVELTIHEGWNHQVKRMFEAVGNPVVTLKRERFGFLDLGKIHLNPGEWQYLSAFDVDKLKKIAKSNLED